MLRKCGNESQRPSRDQAGTSNRDGLCACFRGKTATGEIGDDCWRDTSLGGIEPLPGIPGKRIQVCMEHERRITVLRRSLIGGRCSFRISTQFLTARVPRIPWRTTISEVSNHDRIAVRRSAAGRHPTGTPFVTNSFHAEWSPVASGRTAGQAEADFWTGLTISGTITNHYTDIEEAKHVPQGYAQARFFGDD